MDEIDWSAVTFREVLRPGGWYGPERLSDALFESAGHHARTALEDYTREDERHVDAAFHCGAAIEHIAKSYLASLHPVLIAEGRDFDSLLVLSGNHEKAKRGDASEVKTVGLAEACARLKQVLPSFRYSDNDLRVLAASRNSAAHLGVSSPDLRRAVQVMVTLVAEVLSASKKQTSVFWGGFEGLAAMLRDEAVAEVDRIVGSKFAAAIALQSQRLAGLNETERSVVLQAISGKITWTSEYEHPQACPVCSQIGWLICQLDVDETNTKLSNDDNELMHTVALIDGFYCSACELSLTSVEEARVAKLPEEVDLGFRHHPYE